MTFTSHKSSAKIQIIWLNHLIQLESEALLLAPQDLNKILKAIIIELSPDL